MPVGYFGAVIMTAVAFHSGRGRGWAYAAYAVLFTEAAALTLLFVKQWIAHPTALPRGSWLMVIVIGSILLLGVYGLIVRGRASRQPDDLPPLSGPDSAP